MACPLCDSPHHRRRWSLGDRLFRTTTARFDLHRCRDCGAHFLHPRPTPEELRGFYPRGYWVERRGGAGSVRRVLTGAYRQLVLGDHRRFLARVAAGQEERGLPLRHLDVGCGDGSYLSLSPAPVRVGLDLAPAALANVRGRGLQAVRGSVPGSPFRSGSFTLVSMLHYLEHLPAPEPALAEVRRLLVPGGDLIVQIPVLDSWQARLLGRWWGGLDVPRHLVDYRAANLRSALAAAGFAVIRESRLSLRDNPTALANSLVPALYPPARAARRRGHQGLAGWVGDLVYLGVVLLALPFTLLETAAGRGATVMVQARLRP